MPRGFILIFANDDACFWFDEPHICDYNNTVIRRFLIMILSNQQRREWQIPMISNSFRQKRNCFWIFQDSLSGFRIQSPLGYNDVAKENVVAYIHVDSFLILIVRKNKIMLWPKKQQCVKLDKQKTAYIYVQFLYNLV